MAEEPNKFTRAPQYKLKYAIVEIPFVFLHSETVWNLEFFIERSLTFSIVFQISKLFAFRIQIQAASG
jgi:hypothetical protein